MKKIKAHINTYCTFCKAEGLEKVKAVWRLSYLSDSRACDRHKNDLAKQEYKESEHCSEADYQTWMRL